MAVSALGCEGNELRREDQSKERSSFPPKDAN
jgi:hypothetical protein